MRCGRSDGHGQGASGHSGIDGGGGGGGDDDNDDEDDKEKEEEAARGRRISGRTTAVIASRTW